MNNHWLSESCAEGAGSTILLGPLELDILKNEIGENLCRSIMDSF